MILVKKTPLGEIRRNKRLVIFIDDLQDYVLSPRRDSDSKALIGDSCTTTLLSSRNLVSRRAKGGDRGYMRFRGRNTSN